MPTKDWDKNHVLVENLVPGGGRIVAYARISCYLTQIELGRLMGKTDSWVSYIENDKRILSSDLLIKITDILTICAHGNEKSYLAIDLLRKNYIPLHGWPHQKKINKWAYNLKRIRYLMKLKRKDLADLLDVDVETIHRWEHYEHIPSSKINFVCDKLVNLAEDNALALSFISQLRSTVYAKPKKRGPKVSKSRKRKVNQK